MLTVAGTSPLPRLRAEAARAPFDGWTRARRRLVGGCDGGEGCETHRLQRFASSALEQRLQVAGVSSSCAMSWLAGTCARELLRGVSAAQLAQQQFAGTAAMQTCDKKRGQSYWIDDVIVKIEDSLVSYRPLAHYLLFLAAFWQPFDAHARTSWIGADAPARRCRRGLSRITARSARQPHTDTYSAEPTMLCARARALATLALVALEASAEPWLDAAVSKSHKKRDPIAKKYGQWIPRRICGASVWTIAWPK